MAKSAKGVRHSAETRRQVAVLFEGGWNRHQVKRIMERDGISVAWATIKRWTDPKYAEHVRVTNRKSERLRSQGRLCRSGGTRSMGHYLRRLERLGNDW